MTRSALVIVFAISLLAIGARTLGAQAVESADARQFRIQAGGMASAFQPGEGNNYLVGGGTYVDFHFSHWFQLEGEARWLRFNQYYGEHQDNYLIGPRVPLVHLGRRGEVYAKGLIGYGKMTFPFGYGYGTFTDIALGETYEVQLTRRISVRALDVEWQDWPKWLNNKPLYPYGVSVGVAYRVF